MTTTNETDYLTDDNLSINFEKIDFNKLSLDEFAKASNVISVYFHLNYINEGEDGNGKYIDDKTFSTIYTPSITGLLRSLYLCGIDGSDLGIFLLPLESLLTFGDTFLPEFYDKFGIKLDEKQLNELKTSIKQLATNYIKMISKFGFTMLLPLFVKEHEKEYKTEFQKLEQIHPTNKKEEEELNNKKIILTTNLHAFHNTLAYKYYTMLKDQIDFDSLLKDEKSNDSSESKSSPTYEEELLKIFK